MLEQEKESTGMCVSFLDAELPVENTLPSRLGNAPGAVIHDCTCFQMVMSHGLPKGSIGIRLLGQRGGRGGSHVVPEAAGGLWEDAQNPRLATGRELLRRRGAQLWSVGAEAGQLRFRWVRRPHRELPRFRSCAECDIVPTLEEHQASRGTGRTANRDGLCVLVPVLPPAVRSQPATYSPWEAAEHPISFASN